MTTPSNKWLPSSAVAKRYGVTLRTLYRWPGNNLNFPKPMVVNKRSYFAEDDLVQWERSKAAASGRSRALEDA